MTLVIFIATIQGYRSSMEKTNDLFDEQLSNIAQLISNTGIANNPAQAFNAPENIAFQLWRDEKTLLLKSNNTPSTTITQLEAGYSYSSFEGYRWRTFVYHSIVHDHWVIAAERNDLRYILAESVVIKAIIPVVISLPLLGLLIWLIIGRGLKPLDQLATQLAEKNSKNLSPVSSGQTPRELTYVVDSINQLLALLDQSLLRERRFASDAAHELRTPLSALKIHLHNLASELPDNNASLNNLTLDADRMAHLIEQLLNLYRTTPDQYAVNFEQLDLYNLTQDILIRHYKLFASKNIDVELQGEHCTVLGDFFSLSILIKNLLDNASKYTNDNGKVVIRLVHNSSTELHIEDNGPGIPAHLRTRVFDQFYRVGGDQHDSNTFGCGLGLAIVKHIIDIHSGSISLGQSKTLGGLSIKIILPDGSISAPINTGSS